jgi:hypothetical protein
MIQQDDIQTVIEQINTGNNGNIGTCNAEDIAIRLLTQNPKLAQEIRNSKLPAPAGTMLPHRINEIKTGTRVFAAFGSDRRGPQAELNEIHPPVILVPEKRFNWQPHSCTKYAVQVTRQIGMGYQAVWLCKPLCPKDDEKRDSGFHTVNRMRFALERVGRDLRDEQVTEAIRGHKPPTVKIEKCPEREYTEFVTWGSLTDSEKINSYAGSGFGTHTDWDELIGTCAASWRGQTGIYKRHVKVCWQRGVEYESEDGFGMRGGMWVRTPLTVVAKFVEGVDVIALQKVAQQNCATEYDQAKQSWNQQYFANIDAVRIFAEQIAQGIDMGGFGQVKDINDLCVAIEQRLKIR